MRALSIRLGMAVAALAVASSACDNLPTAADPGSVEQTTAVASASNQSRVSLCHRVGDGEYIEISVADAAYDTHMAHGDADIGPLGGCNEKSLLTLLVQGGGSGAFVSVTVAAFGSTPETSLANCPDGETCYYDVPAGSTVTLTSNNTWYFFDWSEDHSCSDSCVMNGDRNVWASAY